jgi:hypothetical protein
VANSITPYMGDGYIFEFVKQMRLFRAGKGFLSLV